MGPEGRVQSAPRAAKAGAEATSDKWTFHSEGGETFEVDAEPGRNDPCPCRSGKKYKRCCGEDGAYTWPIVTLVGPDIGGIQAHIHCLHNPTTDARCLLAFVNIDALGPNVRLRRRGMTRMVRNTAAGVGSEVVCITTEDIDDEVARMITATLAESPNANVLIMPMPTG